MSISGVAFVVGVASELLAQVGSDTGAFQFRDEGMPETVEGSLVKRPSVTPGSGNRALLKSGGSHDLLELAGKPPASSRFRFREPGAKRGGRIIGSPGQLHQVGFKRSMDRNDEVTFLVSRF